MLIWTAFTSIEQLTHDKTYFLGMKSGSIILGKVVSEVTENGIHYEFHQLINNFNELDCSTIFSLDEGSSLRKYLACFCEYPEQGTLPEFQIEEDEEDGAYEVQLYFKPNEPYGLMFPSHPRKVFNELYNQDELCMCGHPYYQHYFSKETIGCSKCSCQQFRKRKFQKGDRVFHKNLQRFGTFNEYDIVCPELGCYVTFDSEDNPDDTLHVSVNQLFKVEDGTAR